MELPIIELNTPESREATIEDMREHLRANLSAVPADGPEARAIALLIDVMPGFIRALDRERVQFVEEIRAAKRDGREATGTLDEHLMVLALPIVNMLGSVVVTMVPHSNPKADAEMCERIRQKMFHHLIDNIVAGVEGYVTHASREVVQDNARLHS
jgi:hypothetical protein